MHISALCFVTLVATINAFAFTSPTSGQSLDPTQPITVQWTATSDDPATFDLVIDKPGGLVNNQKIATSISTSSGLYIVAANAAAMTYGDGFVLKAQSATGDILATSPSFALSVGSATTIDGQISYISTHTFTGTPEPTATAQNPLGITTTTDASTASSDGMPSSSSAGSDLTSSASETATATGTMTSGFSTSTFSRTSGSSIQASSTSSASAATSQNAQPRLGSSSQIAFSAAGILAGLAALLA